MSREWLATTGNTASFPTDSFQFQVPWCTKRLGTSADFTGFISIHEAAASRYQPGRGALHDRSRSFRTPSAETKTDGENSFSQTEGRTSDCPGERCSSLECSKSGCSHSARSQTRSAGRTPFRRRYLSQRSIIHLALALSVCLLLPAIAATAFRRGKTAEDKREGRATLSEMSTHPPTNRVAAFAASSPRGEKAKKLVAKAPAAKLVAAATAVIAMAVVIAVINSRRASHRWNELFLGRTSTEVAAKGAPKVDSGPVQVVDGQAALTPDSEGEQSFAYIPVWKRQIANHAIAVIFATVYAFIFCTVITMSREDEPFEEENRDGNPRDFGPSGLVQDAPKDPPPPYASPTEGAASPEPLPPRPTSFPQPFPSLLSPERESDSPRSPPARPPFISMHSQDQDSLPSPSTGQPKTVRQLSRVAESVWQVLDLQRQLHSGNLWKAFFKLEGAMGSDVPAAASHVASEYSREALQETLLCRKAARLARLSTMLVAAKITSYEAKIDAAMDMLGAALKAKAHTEESPDVRPKVIMPTRKVLRKLERGFRAQQNNLRLASELARRAYGLVAKQEADAISNFITLEEEALLFRIHHLEARLEVLKAQVEAATGATEALDGEKQAPYEVLSDSEVALLGATAEDLLKRAAIAGAFIEEPSLVPELAFLFTHDCPVPGSLLRSSFLNDVAHCIERLQHVVNKMTNRS
uniref:Putative transmembrane protein n=1 Tax=Toxoplasma gondii COUG TaxID=1074873 RepID=A0A2G8Y009_TOXGO|nr:putative transmembrane protein [Toxoplasma gondii COUG]